MANGVELLVHIGIDTVNSKGEGFRLLGKKQGAAVKAGEAIVEVDFKKLSAKYEMPVMLIVTYANDQKITFKAPCDVKRGDSVIEY
jgi:phosphotransferase system IIA component